MALTRLVKYALYSIADYVTPVIANLVSLIALLGLAWILVPVYAVTGLAVSIVAATGIATLLKVSVLVWKLHCE